MRTLLLVGGSAEFADALSVASAGASRWVPVDAFPDTPQALFDRVQGVTRPDLLLLAPGHAIDEALALGEVLSRDFATNVVLVAEDPSRVGLAAIRAGIRDVLDQGSTAEELRAALSRWAHLLAAPSAPHPGSPGIPQQHRGRVIGVVSPKGGVGKTTVATNLAVGLAKRAPQSTVLVDLDIHFGDVASALSLAPEYTLPDLTQSANLRDAMALKSLLTLHESGLFVVPGSESPAAADAVSPIAVAQLLEALAGQFQYVVVDTAPGLSEHTLAVLDHTDSLVMVTSLDVPGVRGLRKEIDTLNELGLGGGPRRVVLNFFDASRGLSVADVEATIRGKVDIVLPQTNAVPISVNQGIPLLQGTSREPVARQLAALVNALADPHGESPRSGGRLFARRGKGLGR